MAHTTNIQNAIPTRYDPRVTVKPCEPDRVPYLPVEILYQIAKALPQPKQVYHLALANKDTWEYLQPALYESEVTYEARLAHKYGGESSTSLDQYYGKYFRGEDTAPGMDQPPQENEMKCQEHDTSEECNERDGRLSLENRVFDLELPRFDEPFQIHGAMTALHWAAMQGASALHVAQKAIRSALAHRSSYINGVNLKVRYYRGGVFPDGSPRLLPADLPPPLFLAVAHGNTAVVEALISAGCDLDLLQGQYLCTTHVGRRERKEKRLMSYKIHKECEEFENEEHPPGYCVGEWHSRVDLSEAKPCQTAAHIAIELGHTEILGILLRGGLNAQHGFFPLIHYAVVMGNVAAVKVLIDHDPTLIHSRMGDTDTAVLHTAPFVREGYQRGYIRNGKLKNMVSYLLECGAELEARTHTWTGYDGRSHGGLTALQATLEFVDRVEIEENALIALHAAEVLITMGAAWDQELDFINFEGGLLEYCVRKTVGLVDSQYFASGLDDDTISDMFLYRRIRKAFGRIVKTIIGKATESLSQEDSALDRETHNATFSRAFSCLAEYRAYHGRGPFATDAVGRLLLSTGITPSRRDMLRWKAQILASYNESDESDYEMSDESDDEPWPYGDDKVSARSNEEGSDESDDETSAKGDEYMSKTDGLRHSKSRRAEDGDKSHWEFLLSGLDDDGSVSDIAERELSNTDTEIFSESDDEMFSDETISDEMSSESDDERWFSEDEE